jgi:hypothetical protein
MFMKHYRWFLALVLLVLASLACQTVMGGGTRPAPTEVFPPVGNTNDNFNFNENSNANTNESGNTNSGSGTSDAGFPLPPDATNVTDMGNELVTFQTSMSLDDVMSFYRDTLGKAGYTERTDLTVKAGPTFSMVFDGDPSGKALAVQGVEFNGSVTVTLSLQNL